MKPFVRVTGVPASGKSFLATQLARDLAITHLDIAKQPGHLKEPRMAWSFLRHEMQLAKSAVVETAGTSPYEGGFWSPAECVTVRCSVARDLQKNRLFRRPRSVSEPGYISKMLAIPNPPAGDFEWDGATRIPSDKYAALLADIKGAT